MNRKLMIVVEETGTDEGKGFTVYLSGDTDRLKAENNSSDLSPAEFWGLSLYNICMNALEQSGALKSTESQKEMVK